jgi:hypothetical protein
MADGELQHFFVLVRVELKEAFLADEQMMRGYYRNIGVAAYSEAEAKELIHKAVEDGAVDWLRSEWIDFQTVLPAIKKRSGGVVSPLIWYKSGRILFPQ